MYRGKELQFTDFSGGLVLTRPITELGFNESPDLDNIVVFGKGKGFRSRNGDLQFNSTPMVNNATAVTGLHYYKQEDTDEFLIAVAGNKIFQSPSLNGTMNDITGSVSITSGQDNHWSILTFNNKVLGFGGLSTGPDAPWIWTGSGNVSALTGTPPHAYHAFQANNRIFALRTSANPSRIYWSVLGNEADWTGADSGFADVWTSDNDALTAAAVLNTNTVLLFKENSVHQMQIGTIVDGAFPIYPLFSNIGCAGKNACVVWNGLVYFITSLGHMKVTDGVNIYDETQLPAIHQIDPLWNETNQQRIQHIQGIPYYGDDFEGIIWCVSFGTNQGTHNRAFFWDIRNKCWLQWSTGYACNTLAKKTNGILYGGHYNGTIYEKDVNLRPTDDSNLGNAISAYFTSGWIHESKYETIKQPRKLSISFNTYLNGGSLRVLYGFDFQGLLKEHDLNQTVPSGSQWNVSFWDIDKWNAGPQFDMQGFRVTGRGNFFQYQIHSPNAASPMHIHGLAISGKEYGQKDITH